MLGYRDVLKKVLREKRFVPSDSPAVRSFVERARELFGERLRAVLLQGARLVAPDPAAAKSPYDFIVVVDRYRGAYRNPLAGVLNALLSPNLYRLDLPPDASGGVVRAQYEVVSLGDLRRDTSPRARDLYWAGRLGKRVQVVWHRDDRTAEALLECMEAAAKLSLVLVVGEMPPRFTPDDLIRKALGLSFRAEVGVVPFDRADRLFEGSADDYRRVYGLALEFLVDKEFSRSEAGGPLEVHLGPSEIEVRRRRLERLLARSRRRSIARAHKSAWTVPDYLSSLLDQMERAQGHRVELTGLERRCVPLGLKRLLKPSIEARARPQAPAA